MTDDRPSPIWRAVIYVGAALQGLWIGLPVATQLLIYVMAADVATGLCRAGMQGRLNSHCSFKGMMKKAAMLIVATLCIALDQHVRPEMHLGSIAATGFSATEGLSIVENLKAMGVPVPTALANLFQSMRKSADEEDKKEENDHA